MKNEENLKISAGYTRCKFQDFESYLRTEVDLIEDDVRLVLDENNSKFIIYEIRPGVCSFKDLSEVLFTILNILDLVT